MDMTLLAIYRKSGTAQGLSSCHAVWKMFLDHFRTAAVQKTDGSVECPPDVRTEIFQNVIEKSVILFLFQCLESKITQYKAEFQITNLQNANKRNMTTVQRSPELL